MKVNAEFVDPDRIPSSVLLGGGRTCDPADDVTADGSKKKKKAALLVLLKTVPYT